MSKGASETPKPMETRMFRAGDVVKHRPSGERWVLACDQRGNDVIPAGWPESLARASDCELIEAASDDERMDMLTRVAAIGEGGGYRTRVAKDQLQQARQPLSAPPSEAPTSFQHRCSGCGLRWATTEAGSVAAELCGDCWRKAQPILHGVAKSNPIRTDPVDDAAAQLLLELVCLLPEGTDVRKHPVAEKLLTFTKAVRASLAETPAPQTAWIAKVIQEVAELPDRTSPDDWPDAMLVTADELRRILSGVSPDQEPQP